MAKKRPTLTIQEMEDRLGYRIDDGVNVVEPNRYYSDLRPVPKDIYSRTQRELEEQKKQKPRDAKADASIEVSTESFGLLEEFEYDGDVTTFTRIDHSRIFTFAADITFKFGLRFSLLLTEGEVSRALSAPKFKSDPISDLGPLLSRLPTELRHKVYLFAVPWGVWERQEQGTCLPNLVESLGDHSGFYFPLCQLGLLGACKQMRLETLAFTYRHTVFQLDDIDEAVQLLIAVGQIGRQNIAALEFSWSSTTDFEHQWTNRSASEDIFPTMPSLHVEECVGLLEQCQNLKCLRLRIDGDVVDKMSPNAFQTNSGLRRLRCVRGLERLDILDMSHVPFEGTRFVKWLEEAMLSPKQPSPTFHALPVVEH